MEILVILYFGVLNFYKFDEYDLFNAMYLFTFCDSKNFWITACNLYMSQFWIQLDVAPFVGVTANLLYRVCEGVKQCLFEKKICCI